MSCINVTIKQLATPLRVSAEAQGGVEIVATMCSTSLSSIIKNITQSPTIRIDNFYTQLSVTASIICSIKEVYDFLRVSPAEIQWITDDTGVYYDVQSNVNWIITTAQ